MRVVSREVDASSLLYSMGELRSEVGLRHGHVWPASDELPVGGMAV